MFVVKPLKKGAYDALSQFLCQRIEKQYLRGLPAGAGDGTVSPLPQPLRLSELLFSG
jgi:hypothetical protein